MNHAFAAEPKAHAPTTPRRRSCSKASIAERRAAGTAAAAAAAAAAEQRGCDKEDVVIADEQAASAATFSAVVGGFPARSQACTTCPLAAAAAAESTASIVGGDSFDRSVVVGGGAAVGPPAGGVADGPDPAGGATFRRGPDPCGGAAFRRPDGGAVDGGYPHSWTCDDYDDCWKSEAPESSSAALDKRPPRFRRQTCGAAHASAGGYYGVAAMEDVGSSSGVGSSRSASSGSDEQTGVTRLTSSARPSVTKPAAFVLAPDAAFVLAPDAAFALAPNAAAAPNGGQVAAAADTETQAAAAADAARKLLNLTNDTHFNIIQRNGQRIFGGPPPGWDPNREAPSKGCEVFVGKVPRDCYEDELVPVFGQIGSIYELRLMMDFSGSNRGYLFVRYTNRGDARRAIAELNNFEIRPGKHIGVIQSVDNRKLWISGIPKDRTAEEIKSEMSRYTEGVKDIILYPSPVDKSKTRGYAFVEYETHRAAALARRKLVPNRIRLFDQQIDKVDWAEPENEVDDDVMGKVTKLFIRNLMVGTTEAKIQAIFNDLSGGQVERVKKTKDYAFIHFTSRESAEQAKAKAESSCMRIDGSEIDISWSKPVDKVLYNTRKQLTKALSGGGNSYNDTGLVASPYQAALQSPTAVLHGCITPRPGGAAGIRGLGAPGTAPPRSLLHRLAAHGISPAAANRTANTMRSAVDYLFELCCRNNWGAPEFQLFTNFGSDLSCGAANLPLFRFRVTVPHFPFPANQFWPQTWKRTEDEARTEAATYVLDMMNLIPETVAAVAAQWGIATAADKSCGVGGALLAGNGHRLSNSVSAAAAVDNAQAAINNAMFGTGGAPLYYPAAALHGFYPAAGVGGGAHPAALNSAARVQNGAAAAAAQFPPPAAAFYPGGYMTAEQTSAALASSMNYLTLNAHN